jgi:polyhydroxyalkanoate synthesis regulator phasin
MPSDEMEQLRQRVTELDNRVRTLEEQSQRDRQLLVRQQLRIDELEKQLTELELEPPTAEPLA